MAPLPAVPRRLRGAKRSRGDDVTSGSEGAAAGAQRRAAGQPKGGAQRQAARAAPGKTPRRRWWLAPMRR